MSSRRGLLSAPVAPEHLSSRIHLDGVLNLCRLVFLLLLLFGPPLGTQIQDPSLSLTPDTSCARRVIVPACLRYARALPSYIRWTVPHRRDAPTFFLSSTTISDAGNDHQALALGSAAVVSILNLPLVDEESSRCARIVSFSGLDLALKISITASRPLFPYALRLQDLFRFDPGDFNTGGQLPTSILHFSSLDSSNCEQAEDFERCSAAAGVWRTWRSVRWRGLEIKWIGEFERISGWMKIGLVGVRGSAGASSPSCTPRTFILTSPPLNLDCVTPISPVASSGSIQNIASEMKTLAIRCSLPLIPGNVSLRLDDINHVYPAAQLMPGIGSPLRSDKSMTHFGIFLNC
ncbi:hypothetical protein R3P38DRAFT_3226317 [Favolaschia claudopus]|uniref:Uncharacterized protein n=1 Tax=Favolaschia claudopus TaxID=2862362 RepID=A0AAV9ZV45_9AGAR